MAAADLLIVENGTGIANANSYVTLPEFLEYCTLYAYADVIELSDIAQVAALVKATDYIETFSYRGVKAYASQGLSFPRIGCYPAGASMAIPFDAIPSKIKRAQMSAAVISAGGVDLQPVAEPSGFVTSVKVGPIEEKYADGVSNGMTFPIFSSVDSLLYDYIQAGNGPGKYTLRTNRI